VGFLSDGEVCITATTRNFKGRKGSVNAEIYLAGPLTVAAAAVAGEIVNPRRCSVGFDFNRVISGRVWKFGDSIETDAINPYYRYPTMAELKQHTMEVYRPEFPGRSNRVT